VVVEVAGRDLAFATVEGQHQEQLEFALRTIDFLARSSNNQKTSMALHVPPERLDSLQLTSVRWVSTLELPPGHYSLRVAGHAVHTGRTGSVFLDIDVPKFDDDRLWIGGLAVTSSSTALAVTAGTSPAALTLPSPATTARTFVRGDVITLSAGVTTPADFATGTIRLTVHPTSGPIDAPPILDRMMELTNREVAHQPRAWVLHTAALPTATYVLRLTLRDGDGRSADTAVLFDVVEPAALAQTP
jgi:hypothetical protein